jgi:hypoxanthine phosphoribosyltransferase
MLEAGKSLIAAKKYLEGKKAIVKTACLYIMPNAEIKPDFYLKEVKTVIKFPWE